MSNMSGEDGPPPNVEHEFFNEGDDSLISNTGGVPEDSSSSDDDYLPPLCLKYRILFFFFFFGVEFGILCSIKTECVYYLTRQFKIHCLYMYIYDTYAKKIVYLML